MSAPARADTRGLVERVHGCLPRDHDACRKLLGVLAVEWSDAVPTACVTLGARSRLLLNREFVERHCATDERLATLVLHELMHVVLGHTRVYERLTPAQNVAFDALINAALCRARPGPAWTALFRGLYDAGQAPEALLRPPPGWGTGAVRWPLGGRLGEVHRALYEGTPVTAGELVALLEATALDWPPGGVLLGTHGEDGDDAGDHDGCGEPELTQLLEEAARELVPEASRGRGDGLGRACGPLLKPLPPRQRAARVLRRALEWAAGVAPGAMGGGPRRMQPALLPWWRGSDRRAACLLAAGSPLVLSREPLATRERGSGARVHLYLDASGSILGLLPALYGVLGALREHLHPRVHLFSTEVFDVPLATLGRGELQTTRGTDIACVTQHIASQGVRRAVIVTDGLFGEVPPAHPDAMRRLRLGVVLTANGLTRFTSPLGARTWRLPELEEVDWVGV